MNGNRAFCIASLLLLYLMLFVFLFRFLSPDLSPARSVRPGLFSHWKSQIQAYETE